jgi:3-oxoacyl-[acyl-carrier-protein] synthase III
MTMLDAYNKGKIKKGDKVVMMGVGSGIVTGIIGVEF